MNLNNNYEFQDEIDIQVDSEDEVDYEVDSEDEVINEEQEDDENSTINIRDMISKVAYDSNLRNNNKLNEAIEWLEESHGSKTINSRSSGNITEEDRKTILEIQKLMKVPLFDINKNYMIKSKPTRGQTTTTTTNHQLNKESLDYPFSNIKRLPTVSPKKKSPLQPYSSPKCATKDRENKSNHS